MAVGVPEHEVFAAADAVLARGERPTVERVRLELGRGSPARVGGLLDQWWARLAERLNGETRLPALPAEVAQAFVAIWQQAIQLAQGVAEQSLDQHRQVLAAERERVAVIEDQARQDAAQCRQQAAEALAGRQTAETRLADLDQLLAQRRAQIEDLQQQRGALQRDRDALHQQLQVLQAELHDTQHQAEHARLEQDAYVRGVEDRAYREIDRAREESKTHQFERRELQRQFDQLQQRLEQDRHAMNETQRQAAAQQARAEVAAEQGEQQRQALEGRLQATQQALDAARHTAVAQQARADTLEQQLAQQQAPNLRKPRIKKG